MKAIHTWKDVCELLAAKYNTDLITVNTVLRRKFKSMTPLESNLEADIKAIKEEIDYIADILGGWPFEGMEDFIVVVPRPTERKKRKEKTK